MTSYFMIVSILIHIITISAIIILNKGYKRLSRQSRKNATNTSEIMDIMKNYLDEIKQENSFLQQELLKSKSNLKAPSKNIAETEKSSSSVEKPEMGTFTNNETKFVVESKLDSERDMKKEHNSQRDQKELEVKQDSFQFFLPKKDVQDDVEVSLQSRIMRLHNDGYTVEEIARSVGCGKTEAELIIKIYEKSNN
ncbi:hypothetical protein [Ornithinibacillus halotolerans]|uniref:Uncharacterized protein n=1 Tax=Ornithinibacillus halotolerans TaxID=1274357 RepID=A0A916RMJ4_9BACI|nr:hypothetical protein [Ornithinibacillus halotolerans]GGA62786.1 hypothetical protein GCM10008025_03510 [Ornithinibacillus halotolerans]